MRSFPVLLALIGVALAARLLASDPIGIYAVVDRVVFEPAEGLPVRIQVWGSFTFSPGPGEGDLYESPTRGYLYYSLPEGQEELARIEWSDLEKLSGSGQCVGFTSRYQPRGRLRPAPEIPREPDVYPVAMGLVKVRSDTDYVPVKAVLSLPAPVFPPDGGSIVPGKLTLVVRNVPDTERAQASYTFRIQGSSGEEESPPVPSGKIETRWSPALLGRTGEEYSWRVWASEGEWTGPTATSSFAFTFRRGDSNADAEVDISDAVFILEHLFLGGPEPRPEEAGDVDDSGKLDVTDPIYLLNFLFLGGRPPPDPF